MDVLPGDGHHRERVLVNSTEMSFVDVGEGEPVVFLHGNPTWSYLWRNVIPHLADRRRCLAPDLVGMGQSGPAPDGRYRFVDQASYVDGWFVVAIAYMGAMVEPRNWSDFPEDRRGPFQRLRSPEGDRLVFEENFFVETVLLMSIMRTLSEPEMDAYRAPFRDPASQTPTLVWPRELPLEGEPRDVFEIFEQHGA